MAEIRVNSFALGDRVGCIAPSGRGGVPHAETYLWVSRAACHFTCSESTRSLSRGRGAHLKTCQTHDPILLAQMERISCDENQAFMDGRNNHDGWLSDQALALARSTRVGDRRPLSPDSGDRADHASRPPRAHASPGDPKPEYALALEVLWHPGADLGSCWYQPRYAGSRDRTRARLRNGSFGRACLYAGRRQRDLCRDSAGDDRAAA